MINPCQYTVRRCRKSGAQYGRIHYSADLQVTVCGINLPGLTVVLTNDGTGEATCQTCKWRAAGLRPRATEGGGGA